MNIKKSPAIAGRIHCALLSGQLLLPTPSEVEAAAEQMNPDHRRACVALLDRWASLTADAQALAAGEMEAITIKQTFTVGDRTFDAQIVALLEESRQPIEAIELEAEEGRAVLAEEVQ